MKIIIVGAGISGLSTYLFMKKYLPTETNGSESQPTKHKYDITIYDSHAVPSRSDVSSAPTDGDVTHSGLLIGGGLGVAPNGLRVLRALDPKIYEDVVRRGYSVDRFQFRNAQNSVLGSIPCGNRERWGAGMLMCTRQAVWDVLRARVPDEVVLGNRKVKKVELEDGRVIFENGESENADMVIGADGVWSVVRESIRKTKLQFE
jgi:2-polyprenyl-6-methoxyphenol hydroxylase-like FAD-dependent oxidoreductase